MSVARTRYVLQTIAVDTVSHGRTVALAAGALAIAALTLAVRSGGLAGSALVVALAAATAAAGLWFRLQAIERSNAALALTVADLAARLDLVSATAPPVSSAAPLADSTLDATGTGGASAETPVKMAESEGLASDSAVAIGPIGESTDTSESSPPGAGTESSTSAVALDPALTAPPSAADEGGPAPLDVASATIAERGDDHVLADESETTVSERIGDTLTVPPAVSPGEVAVIVASDLDEPDQAEAAASPLVAELQTPEAMPAFTLTALNGAAVTDASLSGTPAVVVFWRPGCQHCQRLTPELVAWESLQGPRLIVFAACDGPTAFRAGLPGLVILDPGFTVGQAIGAPGTPAALPLEESGRPSGPVVAGASAVTVLLLDAMRDWASVEAKPLPELSADMVDVDVVAETSAETGEDAVEATEEVPLAPPTVLLRRVEEIASDAVVTAPDWDAEAVVRRVG